MNTLDWRISEINMIVHIRQTSGKLLQFKQRRDIGLVFVEFGSIRFDYKDETHFADSSKVMLISQDMDYTFTFESNCSFYVINFNLKNKLPDFTFYAFDAPVHDDILEIVSQMCIDWDFQPDSAQFAQIYKMYQLLNVISNASSRQLTGIYMKIEPSIEYLKEHYTDPDISNERLAEESGISTVYFRKLFTQQFGESPMNYIRHQRIEHAKLLLRSAYYGSISDIAINCGFTSIYHFSKTFKQLTGMSPTEYLSNHSDSSIS